MINNPMNNNPMNTSTPAYKTFRAITFVAVSAALSAVIAYLSSTPNLLGVYTILVNGALVWVKNTYFDGQSQSKA